METTSTNQNFADSILKGVFADVSQPENAYNVSEMLDKFGLNWKVQKLPLILPSGEQTGFFGIVRDDTRTTFATCKEGYTPFQNSELSEMLIRISEQTGYKIHTGGKFNEGAKVFLQLESPNQIKGIGTNNDSVEGFLTGINSHDGSTSLKWGETNITISCRNTFNRAMRQLRNSSKHTQSIHANVDQAIRELQGVVMEEKSLFDQFIKLSQIPVTRESIAQVVKSITNVNVLDNSYKTDKSISTYSINRTNELLVSGRLETNPCRIPVKVRGKYLP